MRNFTLKIDSDECVGDSLGKHNFNCLSLDSILCNLSSLFFYNSDGIIPLQKTFEDLNTNKDLYEKNLTPMVNPIRFDRMYIGYNLLSSYYSKQELTVQYEFNKYIADTSANLNYLTLQTDNFVDKMINKSDSYIEKIYKINDYPNGSIINVIFPIFQSDGSIVQKYKLSKPYSLTEMDSTEYSTLPKFTTECRVISGFFEKNDNSISSIPTLKFIKDSTGWTYVKTLSTLSTNAQLDASYLEFKSSTEWKVPLGTLYVEVLNLVGGGGGGSGSSANSWYGAGGGGGQSSSPGKYYVSSNEIIKVTIGQGGLGGNILNNGGNGGNTTFGKLVAYGGYGGKYSQAGFESEGGLAGGSGATLGQNGRKNIAGSGGDSYGTGTTDGKSANANSGAGGGGGKDGRGGNGGSGYVKIKYYIDPLLKQRLEKEAMDLQNLAAAIKAVETAESEKSINALNVAQAAVNKLT